MTVATHDAPPEGLAVVAAYGLPGHDVVCHEPMGDDEWALFVPAMVRHRVVGLAAAAQGARALVTTEQQADLLGYLHRTALARCLLAERVAIRAASTLAESGIDVRMLKGVATAHLDHPDPALRTFVDADVLIPHGSIEAVARALAEVGLTRSVAPLSATYERRFAKATTFVDASGMQVDAHRTLALAPVGLAIPVADLWGPGEPFSLGGSSLRALSRERRVLHAAVTAAIGDWPPRLMAQRDLAQMLCAQQLDLPLLLAIADRWRARELLQLAIADTWRSLGLADDLVPGLAEHLEAPPSRGPADGRALRRLQLYRRPDRSFTRLALASFPEVPGPDRGDYARAMLLPDRRHVRNRLGKIAGAVGVRRRVQEPGRGSHR